MQTVSEANAAGSLERCPSSSPALINLGAIVGASVHNEPYRHFIAADFIRAEGANAIERDSLH